VINWTKKTQSVADGHEKSKAFEKIAEHGKASMGGERLVTSVIVQQGRIEKKSARSQKKGVGILFTTKTRRWRKKAKKGG